jgi:hypothetical protein
MEEGKTNLTFSDDQNGVGSLPPRPIIVVTDVPAEVCDICGEEIVDAKTAKKVEDLVTDVVFWWGRNPSKLVEDESVVVGGEPGDEGGVVRLSFQTTNLPYDRIHDRPTEPEQD